MNTYNRYSSSFMHMHIQWCVTPSVSSKRLELKSRLTRKYSYCAHFKSILRKSDLKKTSSSFISKKRVWKMQYGLPVIHILCNTCSLEKLISHAQHLPTDVCIVTKWCWQDKFSLNKSKISCTAGESMKELPMMYCYLTPISFPLWIRYAASYSSLYSLKCCTMCNNRTDF